MAKMSQPESLIVGVTQFAVFKLRIQVSLGSPGEGFLVTLVIEKLIFFASSSVLQFLTFTEINFEAPSPSAATLFARLRRTLNKDKLN